MRKPNLEYTRTNAFKREKQNERSVLSILNDLNIQKEMESSLEENHALNEKENFTTIKSDIDYNNPLRLKRLNKIKSEKMYREGVDNSLKNVLTTITFNALNLDKKTVLENKRTILNKIHEFYEESFKLGVINEASFIDNEYEMTKEIHRAITYLENKKVVININVDSKVKNSKDGEFSTQCANIEEPSDEELDQELEDSEDAKENIGLEDGEEEPKEDSEDENEDDDKEPSEEELEKELKDSEKDEEEAEPEDGKKTAKDSIKDTSKNISDTVKSKVSDVLNAEKEAAKIVKETEKEIKESNTGFYIKPKPTLFKSIMMNSEKNFIIESGDVYKSDRNKLMNTVLNNSIIVYTVLETMNTMGLIPSNPEFVQYISGVFRR